MKILVNLFHSNLEKSTVNRRWLKELEGHSQITINQPYSKYPDGIINITKEQQLLSEHDRLVFQHPFLWYSVPSLMKQWLDDVLSYGWAYGPGGTALHGKDWVSVISTGGPKESYQAGGFNNFTMSELLKPLQQTANLIGANYLAPFVLHGTVQVSPEAIEASAAELIRHITNPELDPKLRLKRLQGELEKAGTTMDH
jgi:putative NADPH-quinone reductase